MFMNAECED